MIGSCKCQLCKNFLTPDKHSKEWRCEAFPDGIPEDKICYIDFDPCDNCNNGFGFERVEFEEYDGYSMPKKQGFSNEEEKEKEYKAHDERMKKYLMDQEPINTKTALRLGRFYQL